MKKTNKQIIEEIKALLDELEPQNSSHETTKETKLVKKDNTGCAGGLRLLMDENYFDQPHNKQEVTDKLREMGRNYPPHLISMNLLNLCKKRVLVRLGKPGNYKFVIRK